MLDYNKKVWIFRQKSKGKLTDQEIACAQNVTRKTLQTIWSSYRYSGFDALREKAVGRKIDEIPISIQEAILQKRSFGFGILKIEALLRLEGTNVSHNKIHRFLKEKALVLEEPKKGKRRKYIRWERKHSKSLWQTDFCWQECSQTWLIAYLDDHSRFIVGVTETDHATTEIAIRLFDKSRKRYGNPREVISDRGTQFYKDRGESLYVKALRDRGVNHIAASVRKPTTCGKLERFWLTHNTERYRFNSLQNFISYYNFKRHHMSLDYRTPYEVFCKDLRV
jgi:putative transposase